MYIYIYIHICTYIYIYIHIIHIIYVCVLGMHRRASPCAASRGHFCQGSNDPWTLSAVFRMLRSRIDGSRLEAGSVPLRGCDL